MSRINKRHIAIAVLGISGSVGAIALLNNTVSSYNTSRADASLTKHESSAAASTTEQPAEPASPDDRMDQFLTQHGNPPEQRAHMRDIAREVCSDLGATSDYNLQVSILTIQANMNPDAARVFLNGAIDIYCPVYNELKPH
ncbi:DUF732 domain-containing protein [Nocardia sp. NPDC051570]|uniref:DUF732 domain-containing protein n=1 Tax=Nocardia sp. NPDC051570 TaxID=3364324 RepID=UPI0037912D4F